MAKGYSQIYGKDYRQTFALIINMASIRWLMQITVQYDLIIHHMGVKSAYSNGHLDYEIYVEPPEGFEGKIGNYASKLKKSLYGLKQSGRTWNKTFHTYLTTQNFVQSPFHSCMYVQNVRDQISIILLWVDDILVPSKLRHILCKSRQDWTQDSKWLILDNYPRS